MIVPRDFAFLFCNDYFDKTQPDSDYTEEYLYVKKMGIPVYLFSLESFLESKKLSITAADKPTTLIYRGWMITYEQYSALYSLLLDKGLSLINTPEQYRQCHHLPSWYDMLADNTAKSVWTQGIPSETEITQLLKPFGNNALIVKDFVKSRKHEWEEACFIPCANDIAHAIQVVNIFVQRQGEDLIGGVVLREYLPLRPQGTHEKSGMPISKEVRAFCLRHEPFAYIQYWSGKKSLDTSEYQNLINKCNTLNSDFYVIDMAQKENGEWVIIEVGDGQVSGLQDFSVTSFYDAMLEIY
jgi:hypothetical protein